MKVIKGGNNQDGNHTPELKGAFLKFLKYFFNTPDSIKENYHLGTISWNIATSCTVIRIDKESVLSATLEASMISKKELGLVSKMIDYKLETFPKILQVIKNVTFDLTDKSMESFDLQVIAMDNAMETGDFLDELGFEDEDFEDEDFEDEDFDDGFFSGFIQRSGIAVKPKRNFANITELQYRYVQWTVYLFEDESELDKDIKDIAKSWLEDITITEAHKYELELEMDRKITYKFFDANFEYFFVPDVFDLMEIPVDKH